MFKDSYYLFSKRIVKLENTFKEEENVGVHLFVPLEVFYYFQWQNGFWKVWVHHQLGLESWFER